MQVRAGTLFTITGDLVSRKACLHDILISYYFRLMNFVNRLVRLPDSRKIPRIGSTVDITMCRKGSGLNMFHTCPLWNLITLILP